MKWSGGFMVLGGDRGNGNFSGVQWGKMGEGEWG